VCRRAPIVCSLTARDRRSGALETAYRLHSCGVRARLVAVPQARRDPVMRDPRGDQPVCAPCAVCDSCICKKVRPIGCAASALRPSSLVRANGCDGPRRSTARGPSRFGVHFCTSTFVRGGISQSLCNSSRRTTRFRYPRGTGTILGYQQCVSFHSAATLVSRVTRHCRWAPTQSPHTSETSARTRSRTLSHAQSLTPRAGQEPALAPALVPAPAPALMSPALISTRGGRRYATR